MESKVFRFERERLLKLERVGRVGGRQVELLENSSNGNERFLPSEGAALEVGCNSLVLACEIIKLVINLRYKHEHRFQMEPRLWAKVQTFC